MQRRRPAKAVGVSNTRLGVSNPRLVVFNTRLGVSNTRLGVSKTRKCVSNTFPGVSTPPADSLEQRRVVLPGSVSVCVTVGMRGYVESESARKRERERA